MKKAAKALLSAAGLTLAGAYGLYRYAFYSPAGLQNEDHVIPLPEYRTEERKRVHELIDRLNAIPYERVSVISFDGLHLSGRYYASRHDAPLVIMFHGYRGTPLRDFCGGALLCLALGYNVLLIEQRGHCASEGHTISFGVNERRDCLSWCRWATERFRTPILLSDISMGAATVLMASELELPESVRGIIADCPYTTPEAIIRRVGQRMHLPASLAMPLVRLGALVIGGFSLDVSGAASAVQRARVPILLIHGEADDFVPCDMSREIAAANPRLVEFHTFPGAWHGGSYLADPTRYTSLVKAFCKRVLENQESAE